MVNITPFNLQRCRGEHAVKYKYSLILAVQQLLLTAVDMCTEQGYWASC